MFSNKFFSLSKGQNRAYSKNLVEWLSLERGVVRKSGYSYSCIDQNGKDSECPKKSRFRFSLDLEYWNWNTKTWEPYSDDHIALELTMMTPKYRQVLPESKDKKGHYHIIGNIPDRMGTYRFKISHSRPGWNRIWLYKKILARNKTNVDMVKKWGRDLVAAVGLVCILASFAVVSYIFLYNDDRQSLLN
jgi:hypothetical protein